MEKDLFEAVLLDIKTLIEKNPNDGELGGKVRNYFNELPIIVGNFKEKLNQTNTYDEGLN